MEIEIIMFLQLQKVMYFSKILIYIIVLIVSYFIFFGFFLEFLYDFLQ